MKAPWQPKAQPVKLEDPEPAGPDPDDSGLDGSVPEPVSSPGFLSLGPRQRTVLISWSAFTATFALTRGLTYAIRNNLIPFGDVHAGGVHLHHYLWGIQLLAASGGVAIYGSERLRAHPGVVAAYAAGFALVIDEFALLVHLKDVYWTKKGRSSVLIGLGMIAVEGGLLACIPAWRLQRASRESKAGS